MTSCPSFDISHEPDRKSRSLLTVYLIAPCSRFTWLLSEAIFWSSAAFCAADWDWSCLYCASRASYSLCHTHPDRKRAEAASGMRTERRNRVGCDILKPPSCNRLFASPIPLVVVTRSRHEGCA